MESAEQSIANRFLPAAQALTFEKAALFEPLPPMLEAGNRSGAASRSVRMLKPSRAYGGINSDSLSEPTLSRMSCRSSSRSSFRSDPRPPSSATRRHQGRSRARVQIGEARTPAVVDCRGDRRESVYAGDVTLQPGVWRGRKPVPCGASRSTEPDRPQESILRQRGRTKISDNLPNPIRRWNSICQRRS